MPKNISISLGGLKNFSGKAVKNLSWLFFAVFLGLLVLEIFEIQNSTAIIFGVNQAPPVAGVEKGIRINFDNYNAVVGRINQASAFTPSGGISKNPFAVQSVAGP